MLVEKLMDYIANQGVHTWTTFYMQQTGMTQALIYLSIFLLIYFLSFSGFVRNEGRSSKLMETGIAWHVNILNTKYIGDNEGEDIAFEVLLIVLFLISYL